MAVLLLEDLITHLNRWTLPITVLPGRL
jgi:hypothetical protein